MNIGIANDSCRTGISMPIEELELRLNSISLLLYTVHELAFILRTRDYYIAIVLAIDATIAVPIGLRRPS